MSEKIFLSYASEDYDHVKKIFERLQAEGFDPWMDKFKLEPGQRWEKVITKEMKRSDFIIICVSDNYQKRSFLRKEIKMALELAGQMLDDDVFLIPVMLDDSDIPEDLNEYQAIKLSTESDWNKLLTAFRKAINRRHPEQETLEKITSLENSSEIPSTPHEFEYFIFRYQMRNSQNGRGKGEGANPKLIQAYQDGFRAVASAMAAHPWSRPLLPRQIQVFIIEAKDSFISQDQDGVPYVVLPCSTNEPTVDAEVKWAKSEAARRATQIFNCRERPLHDIYSGLWAWFDEALAIFMEETIFPDTSEHLRFIGNWITTPEKPLDDYEASYQAGPFVIYLAKRLSIEFINRVWTESVPAETPFETIARLLPEGQKFVSADPDERDLFASGYCLDSWFLNDPASRAYSPALYARFGERTITESFTLCAGQQVGTSYIREEQDALDHLGCRYYRFYIEEGIQQLTVELHSPDEAGQSPLKAELAFAMKEKRRGHVIPLRPALDNTNGKNLLTASVKQIAQYEMDHLILVVTNCGTRSIITTPHDDGKRFTIKAMAT